jgi:hypothetical protein|tara:strand:- start:4 stop:144 length:141 start_codon:yes stop_codon:yes gene_type:complete
MSGKHSAGKGDRSRISNFKQYQENYDKIFAKKKVSDKNGSKNRKTK